MKILYLTPGVFDKGGISRYNRYQIMALRELLGEDHVNVVSLFGPSQTVQDFETQFQVDWHGVSYATSLRLIAAFTLQSLRFGIEKLPTLIWAAHLNFSALAWFLARIRKASIVVQVYGREVWTPRRSRPDILAGFQRCDHVISDCHFTAKYVETHLNPIDTVEVMWDCVDIERFSPGNPAPSVLDRYGIPSPKHQFNILTLGRLSTHTVYKGYLRLMEVFMHLPPQAYLIYGGGGDLVPLLQAHAQELGIAERVIFTGFIDEADLPDVYRSASVFCLIGDRGPGRGEGIPLTPLEAAACGVPIFVGDQDGSREAVLQGTNGFALDPFDIETIARHVQELMMNETYRQRLGRAARTRVEHEHAYPVFRKRMERFLSRVIYNDQ